MKYTHQEVVNKMRGYAFLRQKRQLLEYELSHTVSISEEELLDTLAVGTSMRSVPVKNSDGNRDRVLDLATSYRGKAEKPNREAHNKVAQEWKAVRSKLDRLDFYMSLLTSEQREILRLCYMERLTWQEIEEKTGYSRPTLVHRRTEAIEKLTEMYHYTSRLTDE